MYAQKSHRENILNSFRGEVNLDDLGKGFLFVIYNYKTVVFPCLLGVYMFVEIN